MRGFRAVAVLAAVFLMWVSPSMVLAGRNAGGALIVHTNDAYSFSSGTACTTSYAIPTSCEEAITRSDKSAGTVVWLLAAFDSTATPSVSGIYFGIDYHDSLNIVSWKFCGPAGTTEIPDDNWPYEGRGNSLAFGTPIEGEHLLPFYVFQIDGGAEGRSFGTAINPTGGYAAFIDDAFPPTTDEVSKFGAISWYEDGENTCPSSGGEDSSETGEPGHDDSTQGQDQEDQGDADIPGLGPAVQLTFIEIDAVPDTAFTAGCSSLAAQYGVRILSGMAPDGLICETAPSQRTALAADPRVRIVTTEPLGEPEDEYPADPRPGEPGYLAHLWNRVLNGMQSDTIRAAGFGPQYSCAYLGDRSESEDVLPLCQTSQYMLGKVGFSVLFMESQQSAESCQAPDYVEDWTLDRVDNVQIAIQAATANLVSQAEPGYLEFYSYETVMCTTSVEPIQLPHSNMDWVHDAMVATHFDTTATDPITCMWHMCNARRSESETDWYYLIFVVNDYCDPDHHFADPEPPVWVSFGSYGGPRVVLLPLNGSGDDIPPSALDYVVAHETCHVFGAEDEYRPIPESCAWPYGYLRVPNTNNIACIGEEQGQMPCLMADSLVYGMCTVTMGQVGLRDSNAPRDGIWDPIDHPDSHMSMRVGEEEDLAVGDIVDIEDEYRHFRKRLAASEWSMDGGRMNWDGIALTGLPDSVGRYTWRRNGGQRHAAMLLGDLIAPAISGLEVHYGPGKDAADTISFRFIDDDTHSGRVRLRLAPEEGGGEIELLKDEYRLDTDGSGEPITIIEPLKAGLWRVRVSVWDGCGGHEVADSLVGVSGVAQAAREDRGIVLSDGWPNPSHDQVVWSLGLQAASLIRVRLVGVDGRCVRSWPVRVMPAGVNRVVWDGRNARGNRVAAGRYYLVVSLVDGSMRSSCVTIVR